MPGTYPLANFSIPHALSPVKAAFSLAGPVPFPYNKGYGYAVRRRGPGMLAERVWRNCPGLLSARKTGCGGRWPRLFRTPRAPMILGIKRGGRGTDPGFRRSVWQGLWPARVI